ncbi:hypothetical protein L2E82_51728 [Cichorium intybus]|nr:hypothetical protein L2E82_51728 [Cichorium intybus]
MSRMTKTNANSRRKNCFLSSLRLPAKPTKNRRSTSLPVLFPYFNPNPRVYFHYQTDSFKLKIPKSSIQCLFNQFGASIP